MREQLQEDIFELTKELIRIFNDIRGHYEKISKNLDTILQCANNDPIGLARMQLSLSKNFDYYNFDSLEFDLKKTFLKLQEKL